MGIEDDFPLMVVIHSPRKLRYALSDDLATKLLHFLV